MKNNRSFFLSVLVILLATVGFIVYFVSTVEINKNIKIFNGCNETNASFIKYKVGDNNRNISYCDLQDKNIMNIESEYVDITNYIKFDYIGNPNGPDTSIYIEDENSRKYIVPKLRTLDRGWVTATVKVPDDFKNKVRVVASDNSVSEKGWLGIGKIIAVNQVEVLNIPIYIQTILFIGLFSFFISALFGFYLKKRNMLDAFVHMSLFVGISSLIVFYSSLYSVQVGQIISILIFLFILKNIVSFNKEIYRVTSLVFLFLVSMMTIILFTAYSDLNGLENFQSISAHRWHHLPVDNWIPMIFADAVLNGHVPSPLFGSWLSSDRPPLQTGFFLIFSNFSTGHLAYLVSSVGLQLLVIIFITMLLMRYVKYEGFILGVIILVFFNGFTFVNALYVWPKLISALYQGIAFYYLYQIYLNKNASKYHYILFGISSSLAFLSHGGSVFYLLALSILFLFIIKNKTDMKRLFYGFVSALIVYLPWVIYQKLIDPPGDRLLKWHLAGQMHVSDDSFLKLFFDYYDKLSLSKWLDTQVRHYEQIFNSLYFNISNFSTISNREFLSNIFRSFDYSFLFFSVFFIVFFWLSKKQSAQIKTLIVLFLGSYFIYILIWSLVLTGNTVIHHGAYFAWFSGFIGIALIIYNINRFIFYIFGILNLFVFFKAFLIPYLFHRDIINSLVVVIMMVIFLLVVFKILQEREIEANKKS